MKTLKTGARTGHKGTTSVLGTICVTVSSIRQSEESAKVESSATVAQYHTDA